MKDKCIYTKAELTQKIKALDMKIESGISESRLDTGQTASSFSKDITALKAQREYYYRLLQVFYHDRASQNIKILYAKKMECLNK